MVPATIISNKVIKTKINTGNKRQSTRLYFLLLWYGRIVAVVFVVRFLVVVMEVDMHLDLDVDLLPHPFRVPCIRRTSIPQAASFVFFFVLVDSTASGRLYNSHSTRLRCTHWLASYNS